MTESIFKRYMTLMGLRATASFPELPTFKAVEIDMGNFPLYSGSFTIPGTNFVTDKPVLIVQAARSCTGKGSRADECEMDMLIATGVVANATTIRAYWTCAPKSGPVRGNIRFSYSIAQ